MHKDELLKLLATEPDYALFYKEDMIYIIKRILKYGYLCGYIALDPTHPLYADDYHDYDVHGGISLEGKDRKYTPEFPGISSNIRLLGFDCAHFDDFYYGAYQHCHASTYKDFQYVLKELDSLAEQIRNRVKSLNEHEMAKNAHENKTCTQNEILCAQEDISTVQKGVQNSSNEKFTVNEK